MAIKRVAPHGTWESHISVDSVVYKDRAPVAPRVNRQSGRAFFAERKEDGRRTLVEITGDGLKDVLPGDSYSVGNRVYEYGGSLYDVLPDDRLIFSNKDDTVRLLDPDTGDVSLLVQSSVLRYSSFCASHTSPWVLAIEEDHTIDEPYKVQNYIVALNIQTSAVKRVVSGSDFYYLPQFSADGLRISWVEWNHPDMPFSAGKLHVADWSLDGSIKNKRLVAGQNCESVAEPRWGPDGSLFFAKEMGPYRKLYRLAPGADSEEMVQLSGLDNAEFGEARLAEGSRTYAPLSADLLVASATTNGVSRLISIDLKTGSWSHLIEPELLCAISGDAVARLESSSVLVVGSGTTSHRTMYKIDVVNRENNKVIRKGIDVSLPAKTYAAPETLHIRSKGSPSRDIYGFLWMPRNPRYTAPDGALPPLIINVHGGPTGHEGCGLNLRTQYFTSRGYACLILNYTGSTGHGREYRESLFGNWGIVDSNDVVECADHLASQGRVSARAISVTGGSAGGYNTLQVLSRYPGKFAGGVCVCGISDLETFATGSHKLEADYTQALVLHPGTSDKERLEIFHERSAIYHTDSINSPLLLLHGSDDTVVPVQQARIITKALEKLGRDVKYIEVAGEGHMFSKRESAKLRLEEEEKWWKKTLIQ